MERIEARIQSTQTHGSHALPIRTAHKPLFGYDANGERGPTNGEWTKKMKRTETINSNTPTKRCDMKLVFAAMATVFSTCCFIYLFILDVNSISLRRSHVMRDFFFVFVLFLPKFCCSTKWRQHTIDRCRKAEMGEKKEKLTVNRIEVWSFSNPSARMNHMCNSVSIKIRS